MEIFESYKEILVETKTADQGLINIFLTQYNDNFLEISCHWNYIEDHCMYEKDLWNKMASERIKRNGFFEGIAINGRRTYNYFRFPLYKTVEKHEFREK
jgi:hypothetical protein